MVQGCVSTIIHRLTKPVATTTKISHATPRVINWQHCRYFHNLDSYHCRTNKLTVWKKV